MNVLIWIIIPSVEWDQYIWIWNLCLHDVNYLGRKEFPEQRNALSLILDKLECSLKCWWRDSWGDTWPCMDFGWDTVHLHHALDSALYPIMLYLAPLWVRKMNSFKTLTAVQMRWANASRSLLIQMFPHKLPGMLAGVFFFFMPLCSHFYCCFFRLCEEINRRGGCWAGSVLGYPGVFMSSQTQLDWKTEGNSGLVGSSSKPPRPRAFSCMIFPLRSCYSSLGPRALRDVPRISAVATNHNFSAQRSAAAPIKEHFKLEQYEKSGNIRLAVSREYWKESHNWKQKPRAWMSHIERETEREKAAQDWVARVSNI